MTNHLEQLDELYRRTNAQLALYRRTCASPALDLAALCGARHGLLSICTRRSKFLQAAIYPVLIDRYGAPFAARVDTLDKDLAIKRRASSQHIATWSIDAVQADWPGFRIAAAHIGRLVETRIVMEQSVVLPALRALAVSRAA